MPFEFELVPILSSPVCGGMVPLHTKSATKMKDNAYT